MPITGPTQPSSILPEGNIFGSHLADKQLEASFSCMHACVAGEAIDVGCNLVAKNLLS